MIKKTGLVFNIFSLMFMIVVVGVLISFILPSVLCSCDSAFPKGANAKIKQVSFQLALYKEDNLSYPTTAQGLQALVSNPSDNQSWRQLLKTVPKDPWNNDFQYQFPGVKNPSSFDLWSFGADGVIGGEGFNADIGNWEEE